MQHAVTRQAALGTSGSMADRPEGRFNRIAGPNALLVLCRKIIEGRITCIGHVCTQRRLHVGVPRFCRSQNGWHVESPTGLKDIQRVVQTHDFTF
jgi:hypothetical protein